MRVRNGFTRAWQCKAAAPLAGAAAFGFTIKTNGLAPLSLSPHA
ncbi:hypothetical protein PAAL109150_13275 [Paenibacillus alkaliterrae]